MRPRQLTKRLSASTVKSLSTTQILHNYILPKKNVEKAEDITNSAISNGIANDSTYMLAGQIQSLLKKPYQAINTMRQLINKNDKSIPAHIFLINLLIQTNQLKEAEDAVKVIILSNPDHLGLKCLVERIKFKNGDKDSAIKFINNTLESNPSNGNVYHDLGNLCIEIAEYKIAIELLEKYLNVSPADVTTITNIATCYARLGKLEPALIGFKAALIFDPTNTYALQNLEVLNKRLKPRTG